MYPLLILCIMGLSALFVLFAWNSPLTRDRPEQRVSPLAGGAIRLIRKAGGGVFVCFVALILLFAIGLEKLRPDPDK